MTPAPGYYNLYWRDPKTRVFQAIPGIHLVGKTESLEKKHLVITSPEIGESHWYTNVPGLLPAWKRWNPK